MSNSNIERYQKKIGCFVQIPNVGRGQLKYVGVVDSKPGIYAGVDLLANIGKNNGSFQGKKYFETEYPQSGLFIQLQKVSALIEQSSVSRRTTLLPENSLSGVAGSDLGSVGGSGNNKLSVSRSSSVNRNVRTNSSGSTIIRSEHSRMNMDPSSPTPMRSHVGNSSRILSTSEDIDNMELDTPSSMIGSNHNNDRRNMVTNKLIKEYESKIDKQYHQLVQYKKLLDEQRVVLEELKPTIDMYESNLNRSELEILNLKEQIEKEHEANEKQKNYFENEHEQLLRVVDQLHEEIKENERRVIATKQQQQQQQQQSTLGASSPENLDALLKEIEELREYKRNAEYNKTKWDKEKDQLKMHNDSLNKEYQELYKEITKLEVLKDQNEILERKLQKLESRTQPESEPILIASQEPEEPQLKETNKTIEIDESNSLPIYQPKREVDATAGRELWCALCDKGGHSSIDCPYLSTSNEINNFKDDPNEDDDDDMMY